MKLCDFSYSPADDGRYFATCVVCGRSVKTRTTKAVAACRSVPRGERPKSSELMQAAGVVTAKPPIVRGPGTELKQLLKDWLGIEATPGCSCNSMAARMDALGPDWCESEAGTAEIVGVMREEHGRRRAAGDTMLPWSDLAARQFIRLACRRARASPKVQ